MIPTEQDIWNLLGEVNVLEVSLAGSRVTCSPVPETSDFDFLVLIPDNQSSKSRLVKVLEDSGYRWEGDSTHYQMVLDTFMSWRKDNTNLIVTASPHFVAKHKVATALCKRLNLLDKAKRISVFQAILYGVDK